MTIHVLPAPTPQTAQEATQTLIERHGAMQVFWIAAQALFKKPRTKSRLPDIYNDPRLRRDIGLEDGASSRTGQRPDF